jgi:hypothetical protein
MLQSKDLHFVKRFARKDLFMRHYSQFHEDDDATLAVLTFALRELKVEDSTLLLFSSRRTDI